MTATQSQSARQKAEAESFLRRVQVEYSYLTILGYQAIINASVEGMKALGVFGDNLTEATFLAGLRHSIDTGVLPKPPASVPPAPPPPTPEELATKEETERLAAKAKRYEEEQQRLIAQQYKTTGRINHAHPTAENSPETIDNKLKQTAHQQDEYRARIEAEAMTIFGNRGIDWKATDNLRKVFATDKRTGEISWQETWALRKIAQTNYEKQKRNR